MAGSARVLVADMEQETQACPFEQGDSASSPSSPGPRLEPDRASAGAREPAVDLDALPLSLSEEAGRAASLDDDVPARSEGRPEQSLVAVANEIRAQQADLASPAPRRSRGRP